LDCIVYLIILPLYVHSERIIFKCSTIWPWVKFDQYWFRSRFNEQHKHLLMSHGARRPAVGLGGKYGLLGVGLPRHQSFERSTGMPMRLGLNIFGDLRRGDLLSNAPCQVLPPVPHIQTLEQFEDPRTDRANASTS